MMFQYWNLSRITNMGVCKEYSAVFSAQNVFSEKIVGKGS